MKMKTVAGVVLIVFVIGLVGVALAEPKQRVRERVHQRVEMMFMWRLTNALDLDTETAAKVFPLVSKQSEERRAFERKAKSIFGDMKKALKEDTIDDAALTHYIEELVKLKADMDEMGRRHLVELREVLTVEQQARLLLLLPEFQEGLRNIVAEARRFGRHGRRGRGRQDRGMSEEERAEWRGKGMGRPSPWWMHED